MAEGWYETNVILHNSVPFLVVAYLAIILYTIMTCVEDKKEKIVLQYAFVSLLFVTLPLLFASPIPSRVYLHSYFFWCILTVVMFRNCGFGEEFFIKKNSALFLRGFLIGYCTFLVCSQGYTWSIYRERDETIKNAISRKSQVILIKKVPLSDMFCYGANIDNDNHKWISYYKQFYGIAEETEVRFVD